MGPDVTNRHPGRHTKETILKEIEAKAGTVPRSAGPQGRWNRPLRLFSYPRLERLVAMRIKMVVALLVVPPLVAIVVASVAT